MKILAVISACVAVVLGRPSLYYPTAYSSYSPYTPYAAVAPVVAPQAHVTYDYNLIPDESPAPAPAPVYVPQYAPYVPTEIKSQYHSQDELGQYAYGHASAGQAHTAVRDFTGAVRGSYTYIDADGKEVVAHYIADQGGFRVSSNALPVAPSFDGVAPVAPEFNLEAPVFDLEAPVFDLEPAMDTPEVEAAKAEHFRLVEEHKAAVAAAIAAAAEAEAAEEVAEETVAEEAPVEAAVAEEAPAEEAPAEEATAEEAPVEAAEEVVEEEAPAEETVVEAAEAEETTEVAEAAEATTDAPVEEAAEESSRRKRALLLNAGVLPSLYTAPIKVEAPTYYSYAPAKPVELKVEAPTTVPLTASLHDAELLRVIHNPGHGVSYRVY